MPTKEKTPVEIPQIVALKTSKNKTEVDRTVLFSIDGKEYSIPVAIRPNEGMQIMHVFRTQGEVAGVDFMLEKLLGTEGHAALMLFDDLEEDDLMKIVKIGFEIVSNAVSKSTPKA